MNPDRQWALDPSQGVKPLDFGTDGVTGSVDPSGRLIALNTYHERYGYVTLTVGAPFPETERYHPAEVRAYRRSLAALKGFGPRFSQSVTRQEAFLLEHALPYIRLHFEDGTPAEVTTFAHSYGAVQLWQCPHPPRWQGRLSLQRCAYTQLTEGGPVEMPPIESLLSFKDGVLVLENPALPIAAAIAGFAAVEAEWFWQVDGPVDVDLPGQAGVTALIYAFGPTAETAQRRASQLAAQDMSLLLEQELERWRAYVGDADRVTARGLVYSLMLAVPVGETRCLLTDHMLLPLSWNRDAYYTAIALLDQRPDIVRQHLLWMFELAERPGGMWGCCYLANGHIKDKAYQLDQQLFPLLELAEYVSAVGDQALWERLRPYITTVEDTLLRHRHPQHWLFPTDETPADDPLTFPYHLSSHILLWRTFSRLYQIEQQPEWKALAAGVRETVFEHFTVDHQGHKLLAYAIDAQGGYRLYHDANDLPLALAPMWGFVETNDSVWRATIAFAFSDQNIGGYYTGRLGSVHTPAPWPLGDIQEMLIARALHDTECEQRALHFLSEAAQWDGALPEAYDPAAGEVVSRHWFAWPNAALTCLLQRGTPPF